MGKVAWLLLPVAFFVGLDRGFYQGDLDRRLKNVDFMSQLVAEEKMRHFKQENYWQDRAEEAEEKLKDAIAKTEVGADA